MDLVKLSSDEFKGVEVPLVTILLQVDNFFLQLIQLAQDSRNFKQDGLLSLLTIHQIAQRLLLEVAIDEEALDLLELSKQVIKLLVVVLLDAVNFFAHGRQLGHLVLNLVLELVDLASQILNRKLVQHDNLVVSVLTQETLEAY